MPSGSGSYLANMANRRRGLVQARERLLDRPGTQRRGGPPPPTAPTQGRTSPQEQSLAAERRQNIPTREELAAQQEQQPGAQPPPVELPPEVREAMLQQLKPMVAELRRTKMAQLHRELGRVRKFFGSGV